MPFVIHRKTPSQLARTIAGIISKVSGRKTSLPKLEKNPASAEEMEVLMEECDLLIGKMHNHVFEVIDITRSHTEQI